MINLTYTLHCLQKAALTLLCVICIACSLISFKASAIVGGNDVNLDNDGYPWTVTLSTSGFHKCGGVLIHPYWVLTAGHCLLDEETSELDVAIGVYDLEAIRAEDSFKVAEIIIHPDYDGITGEYDIGLLRLNRPSSAPVLKLNSDEYLDIPGVAARIIGWGVADPLYNEFPTVLQEANVELNSPSQEFEATYSSDVVLLAADLEKGISGCFGDSGSPLLLQDEYGEWVLAGVTSWGIACGQSGISDIYTRVSKMRSWVLEQIVPTYAHWEFVNDAYGESRDPDQDGQCNFMEFVMATNPWASNPVQNWIGVEGNGKPVFRFMHRINDEVHGTPLMSTSLRADSWVELDIANSQMEDQIAIETGYKIEDYDALEGERHQGPYGVADAVTGFVVDESGRTVLKLDHFDKNKETGEDVDWGTIYISNIDSTDVSDFESLEFSFKSDGYDQQRTILIQLGFAEGVEGNLWNLKEPVTLSEGHGKWVNVSVPLEEAKFERAVSHNKVNDFGLTRLNRVAVVLLNDYKLGLEDGAVVPELPPIAPVYIDFIRFVKQDAYAQMAYSLPFADRIFAMLDLTWAPRIAEIKRELTLKEKIISSLTPAMRWDADNLPYQDFILEKSFGQEEPIVVTATSSYFTPHLQLQSEMGVVLAESTFTFHEETGFFTARLTVQPQDEEASFIRVTPTFEDGAGQFVLRANYGITAGQTVDGSLTEDHVVNVALPHYAQEFTLAMPADLNQPVLVSLGPKNDPLGLVLKHMGTGESIAADITREDNPAVILIEPEHFNSSFLRVASIDELTVADFTLKIMPLADFDDPLAKNIDVGQTTRGELTENHGHNVFFQPQIHYKQDYVLTIPENLDQPIIVKVTPNATDDELWLGLYYDDMVFIDSSYEADSQGNYVLVIEPGQINTATIRVSTLEPMTTANFTVHTLVHDKSLVPDVLTIGPSATTQGTLTLNHGFNPDALEYGIFIYEQVYELEIQDDFQMPILITLTATDFEPSLELFSAQGFIALNLESDSKDRAALLLTANHFADSPIRIHVLSSKQMQIGDYTLTTQPHDESMIPPMGKISLNQTIQGTLTSEHGFNDFSLPGRHFKQDYLLQDTENAPHDWLIKLSSDDFTPILSLYTDGIVDLFGYNDFFGNAVFLVDASELNESSFLRVWTHKQLEVGDFTIKTIPLQDQAAAPDDGIIGHEESIEGSLTELHAFDPDYFNSESPKDSEFYYKQDYHLTLPADVVLEQPITITLNADGFIGYLALFDEQGEFIYESSMDQDGNEFLVVEPEHYGSNFVRVSSFDMLGTGNFTLSATTQGGL